MSLFASYIMALVSSTVTGILILSYSHMNFVTRTPELWTKSLPETFGIMALYLAIMIGIVYALSKPVEDVYKKLEDEKVTPTESDKETIERGYKLITAVSTIGTVFCFIVGGILSNYIKSSMGILSLTSGQFAVLIAHCIGYGTINSMFLKIITAENFKRYREKLRYHVVLPENKSTDSSYVILYTAIAGFIFIGTSMISVGYGFVYAGNEALTGSYMTSATVIGLISIFISGETLFHICKGTSQRIKNATELIDLLQNGNLSSRIHLVANDDLSMLNTSVNKLIKKLQTMIAGIREETEVVSNVATELANVSSDATSSLSKMTGSFSKIESEGKIQNSEIAGAEQNVSGLMSSLKTVENQVIDNAGSMRENSSSISEMTANISSVADMTRKADQVSDQLTQLCKNGKTSLVQATQTISAIQDASIKVKEIVGVLQGIASQTNLLSMNAAIEAAHAGTAGQGFAVVAGEVRSLASSSAESSTKIQEYIQDMVEKIESGVASMDLTSNSFKQIEAGVEQNAELIRSITAAMEEQQRGAQDNMQTTKNAYEGTNRIKDMIVSQNTLIRDVEASMHNVVHATQNMGQAFNEGAEASEIMKDAISRIDLMIKDNKAAVEKVTKQLKTFSL